MLTVALNDWEDLSLLGRGAHGVTYLAFDQDGGQVALKVLPTGGDEAMVADLRRLGEATRRLAHPQVMRWRHVEAEAERALVVMDYAPGGSLGDVIRGGPRVQPGIVLRWAVAASRGLSAAHQASLLHGDLKPSAFLIGGSGEPILSDFALSRVMAGADVDDSVVGSVEYVDPAVSRGVSLDERSDVFSFAVVLFEALCWTREPVRSSRGSGFLDRLGALRVERLPPEVPDSVADVLHRAGDPDPRRRPANATELASLLEDAVGPAPASGSRPGGEQRRRRGRRNASESGPPGPPGSDAAPADETAQVPAAEGSSDAGVAEETAGATGAEGSRRVLETAYFDTAMLDGPTVRRDLARPSVSTGTDAPDSGSAVFGRARPLRRARYQVDGRADVMTPRLSDPSLAPGDVVSSVDTQVDTDQRAPRASVLRARRSRRVLLSAVTLGLVPLAVALASLYRTTTPSGLQAAPHRALSTGLPGGGTGPRPGPRCMPPPPSTHVAGHEVGTVRLSGRCPDTVIWSGEVVTLVSASGASTMRFSFGEAGQLLLGRWNCRDPASPALYEPSLGRLYLFSGWASPGLPARPFASAATTRNGVAEVVHEGRCDRATVRAAQNPSSRASLSYGSGKETP